MPYNKFKYLLKLPNYLYSLCYRIIQYFRGTPDYPLAIWIDSKPTSQELEGILKDSRKWD